MKRSRCCLPLLLIFLSLAADIASARPRGRRPRIVGPSLEAMERKANEVAGVVQAAQQTKAAAEVESAAQQSRASDAASKLSVARSGQAEAASELEEASAERKDLEKQIEDAAGPDHPVTLARKSFEEEKQKVAAERNRVLDSQAWKSRKAAAEKEGRSSSEIATLFSKMLREDREYATALVTYNKARAKYQQLRNQLFAADARWQDAVTSARRAQAEQSESESKSVGQARRQINATTNAREANRTAGAAAATISAGQQTISEMQKRYKDYGGRKPLGKEPIPTAPQPVYRSKQ